MTNVHVSRLFQKTSSLLHALHAYDYIMEQSVKTLRDKQIITQAHNVHRADDVLFCNVVNFPSVAM